MKHLLIGLLMITGAAQAANKTYVGFASDAAVVGTIGNVTPAASLLLGLSEQMMLQTYLQIPTIDPFLFSVAGNLKFTVLGTQTTGFHLGGGMGFSLINGTGAAAGTDRDLVLRFNGIAGAHFYLVNRIFLIVDGGMSLDLNVDTSDADLTLGGNSMLLGLSILYEI